MAEALLVENPGLFTTVQDAGRYGWQRFGISPAGAMDALSLRLANALVGNAPGCAALEVTATGPTLRVEGAGCRLAWAGHMTASVGGRPLDGWTAHDLAPGETLRCGAVRDGLRVVIAVAGGFDLPAVLGSLSTHTGTRLGGLDGRSLRAGDRLPLRWGGANGPPLTLPTIHRPAPDGPVRVVFGPQDDHFTEAGRSAFLAGPYRVGAKSNRMGLQLEGPAIAFRGGYNIVSDGVVHGSIQVAGAGLPIVLLADRQTTGGYPKIATAIGPDLPILARKRPGDVVRFEAVTPAEAEALARQAAATEAAALLALVPYRRDPATLDSGTLLGVNLIGGAVSATDGVPTP